MSNPTDELAEANALASKIRKEADALHDSLLGKLEQESVLSRVKTLQMHIDIAQRDIETITAMAQSRGAEPNVSNLFRTLNERKQELEELKAKHGLQCEDTPRKRWYEFWK